MARTVITRTTCDACGCYCKDGLHGTVRVDTRLEDVGSADFEQVDLCVSCLAKGVTACVAGMSLEARKEWLQRVRRAPSV